MASTQVATVWMMLACAACTKHAQQDVRDAALTHDASVRLDADLTSHPMDASVDATLDATTNTSVDARAEANAEASIDVALDDASSDATERDADILDAADADILDAADAVVATVDATALIDANIDGATDVVDCGDCPDGYTCGTANGIAVCRAPSGVPLFDHVIVVVMENTSRESVEASGAMPFLDALGDAWAVSGAYYGVDRPSLPNYIAMTSGIETHDAVQCNCQPIGPTCPPDECHNHCGCPIDVPHLGDQLDEIGRTWRSYAEGMGTPCNMIASGRYAPKHIPFLYYANVQSDAERCADVLVDYNELAVDLDGHLRNYVLITPDLFNDMHDTTDELPDRFGNGDAWLAAQIPDLIDARVFGERDALFIVWDESEISGDESVDAAIPFYLVSALAKHPYVSTVSANHYSLLATIEDGLGVERLALAADAEPLADFFPDM